MNYVLNRIFPALVLLALALPGNAAQAVSVHPDKEERILDYHSKIEILAYPLMLVTETIEVQALGRQFGWGLYRKPPVTHKDEEGNVIRRSFRVLEALMDGQPAPFTIETHHQSRRIRVGDPARPISRGRHVFTISYEVERFVRRPGGMDELYWNVNGTWDVPIENIGVTVSMPSGAKIKDSSAYTGYWGGDENGPRARDYVMEIESDTVSCRASRALLPGERLILTITWPAAGSKK